MKALFNISICCFFLFPYQIFCQNSKENSSYPEIDLLQKQADSLKNKEKFNASLEALLMAEELVETSNLSESKDTNYYKYLADINNERGYLFRRKGDFKEAESSLNLAKNIIENNLTIDSKESLSNLNEFGILYRDLARYEDSYQAYKKALDFSLEFYPNDTLTLAGMYSNLSQALLFKGDYGEAEKYIKNALTLDLILSEGKEDNYVAGDYAHLAVITSALKDYERSIRYSKKAMDIWLKNKAIEEKSAGVAGILNNIGSGYAKLNQYDLALSYIQKAFDIEQEISDMSPMSKIHTIANLGLIYSKLGEKETSLKLFSQVISYYQDSLQSIHYPVLTKTYLNRGLLYLNSGQVDSALINFHLMTTCASVHREIPLTKNPKSSEIINNRDAIIGLTYKSKCQKLKYHNTDSLYFLLQSLASIETGIDLIKKYRDDLINKESVLIAEEEAYQSFEQGLTVLYELINLSQNGKANVLNELDLTQEDLLEKSYDFIETSKSYLLKKKIRFKALDKIKKISTDFLDKEKALTYDLDILQKQMLKYHNKPKIVDSLIQELNLKIEEFDVFKMDLSQKFPVYYQLKYQETKNIASLQKALGGKKSMLEYFVGDSSIFILLVNENNIRLVKQPHSTEIKSHIKNLKKYLNRIDHQDYNNFVTSAHFLHQKLIEPIHTDLKEKVLVIPDDGLFFFPFEILLPEYPANIQARPEKQFKDLIDKQLYFLFSHQLQYDYSASIYLQNQEYQKVESNQESVVFLPQFDNRLKEEYESFADDNGLLLDTMYLQLGELVASQYVRDYFDNNNTLCRRNFAATELQFLNDLDKNINTLLLFTHAEIDAGNPMNSKIFFAKELTASPEHDGNLYANELYSLNINANLAILACCETGTGNYRRGEGVFSLARGFNYAGCPSVIMSLWQVGEQPTAKILAHINDYLSEGIDKAEALHLAKMTFLEKEVGRETVHPYYWSSLVLVGNDKPLNQSKLTHNWIIFIFGSVLTLLLFWVYRKWR